MSLSCSTTAMKTAARYCADGLLLHSTKSLPISSSWSMKRLRMAPGDISYGVSRSELSPNIRWFEIRKILPQRRFNSSANEMVMKWCFLTRMSAVVSLPAPLLPAMPRIFISLPLLS